jgi:hypothetical protein
MNGIDFSEKVRSATDLWLGCEASQQVFSSKFREQCIEARPQVLWRWKECIRIGDVHGTDLARPVVHILEDVAMDRAEPIIQ